jgi:hypothetical protein
MQFTMAQTQNADAISRDKRLKYFLLLMWIDSFITGSSSMIADSEKQ